MSYILDALRRADSERERGTIPGLHAQPVPPVSDQPARVRRAPMPWRWIAIGVAAGLAVPLAWSLLGSGAPDEAERPAAAAPPLARTPEPAAAAPVATAAAPPAASPLHEERAAPATDPARPSRRAALATTAAAPLAARPPGQAQAAETGPEPRVYALAELPEDIRRQLPALTIGGSIYSTSPASRFLIINGQTFREKEQITPDLSLERIQLKAAVLKFKGYRYGIAY